MSVEHSSMRRRWWLELVNDYDCIIHYHPGKVNIVVDALIRKSIGQLASLPTNQIELIKDLENLWIEKIIHIVDIQDDSIIINIGILKY